MVSYLSYISRQFHPCCKYVQFCHVALKEGLAHWFVNSDIIDNIYRACIFPTVEENLLILGISIPSEYSSYPTERSTCCEICALVRLVEGASCFSRMWGECQRGKRGADICACQVISWSRRSTARGPRRWQRESEIDREEGRKGGRAPDPEREEEQEEA